MTKRQIPDEKITEYTKKYIESHPVPRCGPNTPAGIAKSAKNLKRRTAANNTSLKNLGFAINIDSLSSDSSFTKHQQSYYEQRYKYLKKAFDLNDPYIESLLQFFVLQEIQNRQFYRELNSNKTNKSQKPATMQMLTSGLQNYQNIMKLLVNKSSEIVASELPKLQAALEEANNTISKLKDCFARVTKTNCVLEFNQKVLLGEIEGHEFNKEQFQEMKDSRFFNIT